MSCPMMPMQRFVLVGEQVDREEVLDDPDVRLAADRGDEGLGDGPAGFVAVGVEDAGVRVAAFERRVDLAVDLVEARTPFLQLPDQLGSLADDLFDDLRVGDSAAGAERVGDVRFERVLLPQHRGDAALGVPRVALVDVALADDDDVAVVGGLEGGPQAGDARPHNHAVGEKLAGRNRIDVHQVPPGLAETDLLGRRRSLPFVLLTHMSIVLPIGGERTPAAMKKTWGKPHFADHQGPVQRARHGVSPQSPLAYLNRWQMKTSNDFCKGVVCD